jgi:hypothetical protein
MAMANDHSTMDNEEKCVDVAVVVELLEESIGQVNAWIRSEEIVAINIDLLHRMKA